MTFVACHPPLCHWYRTLHYYLLLEKGTKCPKIHSYIALNLIRREKRVFWQNKELFLTRGAAKICRKWINVCHLGVKVWTAYTYEIEGIQHSAMFSIHINNIANCISKYTVSHAATIRFGMTEEMQLSIHWNEIFHSCTKDSDYIHTRIHLRQMPQCRNPESFMWKQKLA